MVIEKIEGKAKRQTSDVRSQKKITPDVCSSIFVEMTEGYSPKNFL